MYHGFTESRTKGGFENVENSHLDVDKFEKQIKFLKKYYNSISLPYLLQLLKSKKKLPKNPVILTFDDGYESNYKYAFPILKKYNIPASIFITTNFVNDREILWMDRIEYALNKTQLESVRLKILGETITVNEMTESAKIKLLKKVKVLIKNGPQDKIEENVNNIIESLKVNSFDPASLPDIYSPLNWQQINEMLDSTLISIGSHTCSHVILSKCTESRLSEELVKSKKIIESSIGAICDLFCYPNGQKADFNENTKKYLKESGYQCGLTTLQAFNTNNTDLFKLNRLYVSNKDNFQDFVLSLSGLRLIRQKLKLKVD